MHLLDQYVREILVGLAFAAAWSAANQSLDGWISSIQSLNAAVAAVAKKNYAVSARKMNYRAREYIFHNALLMLAGGAA